MPGWEGSGGPCSPGEPGRMALLRPRTAGWAWLGWRYCHAQREEGKSKLITSNEVQQPAYGRSRRLRSKLACKADSHAACPAASAGTPPGVGLGATPTSERPIVCAPAFVALRAFLRVLRVKKSPLTCCRQRAETRRQRRKVKHEGHEGFAGARRNTKASRCVRFEPSVSRTVG